MTFTAPASNAFHTRSGGSMQEGFAPQDQAIVTAVKSALVFMASAGQDQPVMVHAMADSPELRTTLQGGNIPFIPLSEVVSTMEADNHDGGNGQAVKVTRFRFVRGAMQKFPSWVLAKAGEWTMQVIIAHSRGLDYRWASTGKGEGGQATNYPGLNAYCLPEGQWEYKPLKRNPASQAGGAPAGFGQGGGFTAPSNANAFGAPASNPWS